MTNQEITDPGWNVLFLVAGWTVFGFLVLFLFVTLVWLLGKLTPDRPDVQQTLGSFGETPMYKSKTTTRTVVPSPKPEKE